MIVGIILITRGLSPTQPSPPILQMIVLRLGEPSPPLPPPKYFKRSLEFCVMTEEQGRTKVERCHDVATI
jgi:hypothetical protein